MPSWKLALRAERKSPATVKSYAEGVYAFLKWCETTGTPAELTKANAQAFVADLLDNGAAPKTASARLLGLRRFSAWLASRGRTRRRPARWGSSSPRSTSKVIDALTDEELADLFKACRGKRFTDRRDEAIVRLMAETGLRSGELIAMRLDDVNLGRGLAVVRRGKGGKGRVVPFGPQTGSAIDRYLRVRHTHRLADGDQLWLGADNWRPFSYFGLRHALQRRAELAGIKGDTPRRRHPPRRDEGIVKACYGAHRRPHHHRNPSRLRIPRANRRQSSSRDHRRRLADHRAATPGSAGADLDMIQVICIEDDGSGAPVFPATSI